MELMSGNEAIAQGAWEAGAHIGVAYPGTPSTETLEAFAKQGRRVRRVVREREGGRGSGRGGLRRGRARALHHEARGRERGGRPAVHRRLHGRGGRPGGAGGRRSRACTRRRTSRTPTGTPARRTSPCSTPPTSAEALRFTREAYELSERFDVPVHHPLHGARVAHEDARWSPGRAPRRRSSPTRRIAAKWVMMPAFAKPRRRDAARARGGAAGMGRDLPLQRGRAARGRRGRRVRRCRVPARGGGAAGRVACSSWAAPGRLPAEALRAFAGSVESALRGGGGLRVPGRGRARPRRAGDPVRRARCRADGELTPGACARRLRARGAPACPGARRPARPPAGAVPGLPAPPGVQGALAHEGHRHGRHRLLHAGRAAAAFRHGHRAWTWARRCPWRTASSWRWQGTEHRPVVAVIGDSTFAHSGLSSLISTVYNRGGGTVCVLDNRTTAMTGRQGNPFNGETLQKRPSRELDLEGVVRALGVEDVRTVDPHDAQCRARGAEGCNAAQRELSVLVFRAPCVLLERTRKPAYAGDGRLHGMRRVPDARLPGHREGRRDGTGLHRPGPVHRLRPVRPVLRLQRHRAAGRGLP